MESHQQSHRAIGRAGRGFTLIELVIVVVIVGVIGAVAVPRMSSAAEHSKAASLQMSTRVFQDAVDRYTEEHAGLSPWWETPNSFDTDGRNFVRRLTEPTTETGGLRAFATFGPYLREAPANPFTPRRDVRLDTDGRPGGAAFRVGQRDCIVIPDHTSTSAMAGVFSGPSGGLTVAPLTQSDFALAVPPDLLED